MIIREVPSPLLLRGSQREVKKVIVMAWRPERDGWHGDGMEARKRWKE